MEVTYAHLCDYALIAKDSKVSVIGIFDQIQPSTLPFVLPQLYLVFEVAFSYAESGREHEIRLEVVDADGNQLIGLKTRLTLDRQGKPGDKARVPQMVGLSQVRFTRSGAHDFNIFVNEGLKHQLSFRVGDPASPPAGPQLSAPSDDPQP